MAEQLYTIPVNDAFSADCECPLCLLYKDLEEKAIEFTLGPSYMEDDNRAETDRLGFCPKHIKMMYEQKNRLGIALMLNTHMNKTIKDLKALSSKDKPKKKPLLSKKADNPVSAYIDNLNSSCFVCQRIEPVFKRYIDTIFHMYKKDPDFKEKLKNCKGFCLEHYGLLYNSALSYLSQKEIDEFIPLISDSFFKGLERVNGDVSWFIDKYDYRNQNAPWKNSKDALPRAIIKTCHLIIDEE